MPRRQCWRSRVDTSAIPDADAIVSVGHVLSYLPDAPAIDRALVASAGALRADGVLAINICDLTWGSERTDWNTRGWVGDDWALITEVSLPSPDRFVRQMATFTMTPDGSWRRDDERHDNVLIDTTLIPGLLAEHGIEARVGDAVGTEEPLVGLKTVIGYRPSAVPGSDPRS
jgi:hypothetical protein